jgi:pimeloyl-ACP methyl ester carboxylesterase
MFTTKTFARVGDLDIHYQLSDFTDPWRTDEPETFLLYPGYCRNLPFWNAWIPLLGRDYRVLTMDARGYGDTTKPPRGAEVTPEMLANDAIGLMDVLGIKRAHWVGESTGGAVGLVAALNHPERIASITMCNTAAKMGDETVSTYAIGEKDQATAIEKYGVEEWCRRTLHFRMDVTHAAPGLADFVPREMGRTPDYFALAAFRVFSTVDLTPRLPEISAPCLLIVGSKCTPRRRGHIKEMAEKLQHGKYVVLDGYDYGIHFLAPEAVTGEVRKFMKEYFPNVRKPT